MRSITLTFLAGVFLCVTGCNTPYTVETPYGISWSDNLDGTFRPRFMVKPPRGTIQYHGYSVGAAK